MYSTILHERREVLQRRTTNLSKNSHQINPATLVPCSSKCRASLRASSRIWYHRPFRSQWCVEPRPARERSLIHLLGSGEGFEGHSDMGQGQNVPFRCTLPIRTISRVRAPRCFVVSDLSFQVLHTGNAMLRVFPSLCPLLLR
jgi:hypothetical protein